MFRVWVVVACWFFVPNFIFGMNESDPKELPIIDSACDQDLLRMKQFSPKKLLELSESDEDDYVPSHFHDWNQYADNNQQLLFSSGAIQTLDLPTLGKYLSQNRKDYGEEKIRQDLIFLLGIEDDLNLLKTKGKILEAKTVVEMLDDFFKIQQIECEKSRQYACKALKNKKQFAITEQEDLNIAKNRTAEAQYAEFIALILRYPRLLKIGGGSGPANITLLQQNLTSIFSKVDPEDLKEKLGSLFLEYPSLVSLTLLQKIISVEQDLDERAEISAYLFAAWIMHYENAPRILCVPCQIPCCEALELLLLNFEYFYESPKHCQEFEVTQFYQEIQAEWVRVSQFLGQGDNFSTVLMNQLLKNTIYKRLVTDSQKEIQNLRSAMKGQRPSNALKKIATMAEGSSKDLLQEIETHPAVSDTKKNIYKPNEGFFQVRALLKDQAYFFREAKWLAKKSAQDPLMEFLGTLINHQLKKHGFLLLLLELWQENQTLKPYFEALKIEEQGLFNLQGLYEDYVEQQHKSEQNLIAKKMELQLLKDDKAEKAKNSKKLAKIPQKSSNQTKLPASLTVNIQPQEGPLKTSSPRAVTAFSLKEIKSSDNLEPQNLGHALQDHAKDFQSAQDLQLAKDFQLALTKLQRENLQYQQEKSHDQMRIDELEKLLAAKEIESIALAQEQQNLKKQLDEQSNGPFQRVISPQGRKQKKHQQATQILLDEAQQEIQRYQVEVTKYTQQATKIQIEHKYTSEELEKHKSLLQQTHITEKALKQEIQNKALLVANLKDESEKSFQAINTFKEQLLSLQKRLDAKMQNPIDGNIATYAWKNQRLMYEITQLRKAIQQLEKNGQTQAILDELELSATARERFAKEELQCFLEKQKYTSEYEVFQAEKLQLNKKNQELSEFILQLEQKNQEKDNSIANLKNSKNKLRKLVYSLKRPFRQQPMSNGFQSFVTFVPPFGYFYN